MEHSTANNNPENGIFSHREPQICRYKTFQKSEFHKNCKGGQIINWLKMGSIHSLVYLLQMVLVYFNHGVVFAFLTLLLLNIVFIH